MACSRSLRLGLRGPDIRALEEAQHHSDRRSLPLRRARLDRELPKPGFSSALCRVRACGTPPEHLLFGLRAALDMIFAEGLENVFARHRLLAEATRRAVFTWSEGQAIGFNCSEPEERSDTVTTVSMRSGAGSQAIADYCRDKCGVVLGRGLGAHEGKAFRIAHMGHVNAPMIFGTLSVVEMALAALNVPQRCSSGTALPSPSTSRKARASAAATASRLVALPSCSASSSPMPPCSAAATGPCSRPAPFPASAPWRVMQTLPSMGECAS